MTETGTPNTKTDRPRFVPKAWRMHAAVWTIGLFMIGIVGYGFYSGNRMNTVDAPLVQAAMKIKIEAATTNLVLEGLMDGGFVGGFESLWNPLDLAFLNFRSIIDQSKKRKTILPFQAGTVDTADVEKLELALSEFKDKAEKRFAGKRISLFDREEDRIYRLSFKNLIVYLDQLEGSLRKLMSRNLRLFRYSQAIMIVLCLLLTSLAGIMFQRFERQRARAHDSLEYVNRQLADEIVERRRSESAVRASEERFRQLAENIMDLFWLEDVRGDRQIVYVSPTFESWWGRKPEDVYKDREVFWQIVHPQDRERVMQAYRDFTDDIHEFDSRFRIVLPDGSLRWVRSRGFPVRNGQGRIYRVAGLAQDITEQKRYEERQEQLVEELKDFSSAVSHDLRAPLINLKGFSREIKVAIDVTRPVVEAALADISGKRKKKVASTFYEDLPEAVDFMDVSLSKMERLIDSILKLSRLGRRELKPEILDMNKIVQDNLKSMGHQIKDRGIEVFVGNLPETRADKVSVDQIFSNLLSNAINYLEPGRSGKIEITGEARLDENVFHVRDNGRGIDKLDIPKAFNLFERLSDDSVAGEGMGLAYVRALVRRHGGEVFCESEPGAGSEFTFTISKRVV